MPPDALRSCAQWKDHSLELSKQVVVAPNPTGKDGQAPSKDHREEIMHWLDRAMACGYEGVMFKSLASEYSLGARDNDWIKLKPDYVDDMGDDLDLLILAGYYGEGRRRTFQSGCSHFLMGVRAPTSERHVHPNAKHPLLYPLCKVGTGYAADELSQMRAHLSGADHKWEKQRPPEHLCGWVPKKTDDVPDVWYAPERSVVISSPLPQPSPALSPAPPPAPSPKVRAGALDRDERQGV